MNSTLIWRHEKEETIGTGLSRIDCQYNLLMFIQGKIQTTLAEIFSFLLIKR